jgi:hypothetical protein
MTSVPEWDRQFRLVCVHREELGRLGRLRLAGIGADAVPVAGQLGEALSGLVDRHRSVIDLTADRPLKHGRVDEGGFGMRVAGRITARAIFDEHAWRSCGTNALECRAQVCPHSRPCPDGKGPLKVEGTGRTAPCIILSPA